MHNSTWIELDKAALQHNCKVVKALAPDAHILAMLKANGYGHGAAWVAEALADQVQGYGLARLEEARELRSRFPDARLLLLGNLITEEMIRECAALNTDVLIHSMAGAEQFSALPLPQKLNCWLKLNIGMNRLGMSADEFVRAHECLAVSANCGQLIHMSHFPEAEDRDKAETELQSQRLLSLSAGLGKYPCSQANSAAIIAHPNTHREWVRPGIMLYGDDPTCSLSGAMALRPVMHFKSRVIALRDVGPGEGVGYNRRWRASQKRLIATISTGYADGYPRCAPDGTPVLVNGQRANLAGRVSMDLMTVDVSDIPRVQVGDEVTLWGDGLPAAEVGQHCGTISYELFTRITSRVARFYY